MAQLAVAPKARIDALTGLRFFAALVVYLSHHPKPAYFPAWLVTFFNAGYNGVTIFFVLSGFVIGLNYFDALARPTRKNILRFGVARLARIYPLYLLVLLYVLWNGGVTLNSDVIIHVLALQTWSPSLLMAFAFNPPAWSIGVEFFLYACFPLIVLLLVPLAKRTRTLWVLALAVMLCLASIAGYFHFAGYDALPIDNPDSAHRWLFRMPVARLGDFCLGIIAALLFKNRDQWVANSKRLWAILSYVAFAGIIALMLWPAQLFTAFSYDVSYAPLVFLGILGLVIAPGTFLARFMGSRLLVVLGEASFALYLIQLPFMRISGLYLYAGFDPFIAVSLWVVSAICLIALSIALNRFVESPLRHAINRLVEAPRRIPNLRGWLAGLRQKSSFFPGLGLLLFLLVYFSALYWFWGQFALVSTWGQGIGSSSGYSMRPLQIQFVNGIQLSEYGLEKSAPFRGGSTFSILLKWICTGPASEKYELQFGLQDAKDREWVVGRDFYQNPILPCKQVSGSLSHQMTATVAFPLPVTLPAGTYRIVMSLYDRAEHSSVIAYDDSGRALGDPLQITTVLLAKDTASITANELTIENRLFVDMQEMRFLGFTNLPSQIARGDNLDIGLYWRARSKPNGDYVVSVQLRDALDNVLVEQSARPAEDTYPTTQWQSGEVLLDWHQIAAPPDLPPGEYSLAVILRGAEHDQIIGDAKFYTISIVP